MAGVEDKKVRLGAVFSFDPRGFDADLSKIDTIWLFNIAMENGPFIDGLPRKNGDFPWLC